MTLSCVRPLVLGSLFCLAPLAVGCGGQSDAHASERAAASSAGRGSKRHDAAPPPAGDPHGPTHDSASASGRDAPAGFPVPFTDDGESPREVARGFLGAMLVDNARFVKHAGTDHFKPFAEQQKPRATLVTCADSRVQSDAYDASPENDVFTVRNIGNQLATAEGSIEYGVEHLHTPVLVFMGHTGCGAVKAAMGDAAKLSQPIQRELASMHVPKGQAGDADRAWLEGVVANVDDQVVAGLAKFGELVRSGRLVVVGAVYDFRDDLKQGAGRVVVVNVNGNAEPATLAAFTKGLGKPPLER